MHEGAKELNAIKKLISLNILTKTRQKDRSCSFHQDLKVDFTYQTKPVITQSSKLKRLRHCQLSIS